MFFAYICTLHTLLLTKTQSDCHCRQVNTLSPHQQKEGATHEGRGVVSRFREIHQRLIWFDRLFYVLPNKTVCFAVVVHNLHPLNTHTSKIIGPEVKIFIPQVSAKCATWPNTLRMLLMLHGNTPAWGCQLLSQSAKKHVGASFEQGHNVNPKLDNNCWENTFPAVVTFQCLVLCASVLANKCPNQYYY